MEYFSDEYPLRNWDQFLRHYETFTKIRGSWLWAAQLTDPEIVAEMVAMPEKDWASGSGPPPLFGWTDQIDRLADIVDQLIASRATDDKVKFVPRPVVPAVKLRKLRKQDHQMDRVEEARRKNLMRRQAANGT